MDCTSFAPTAQPDLNGKAANSTLPMSDTVATPTVGLTTAVIHEHVINSTVAPSVGLVSTPPPEHVINPWVARAEELSHWVMPHIVARDDAYVEYYVAEG